MYSSRHRRGCISVLALAIASLAAIPAGATGDASREWRFSVLLDDKPIGRHRFLLREGSDGLELTSDASFTVRFLFVDVYRYEHRAHEVWEGGCLERLDARTNENGERTVVVGRRADRSFEVTAGESTRSIDPCVQTFAYWDPRILEARQLLNPQTGEYIPVAVFALGEEALEKDERAHRYRLVGQTSRGAPLQIDLWYSAAREWLGLESRTPDGRRLHYVKE